MPPVLPLAARLLAALVLLAGALVIGPAPAAYACSCKSATVAQHAEDADAVFQGVIVERPERVPGERRLVYRVEVDRVYQGTVDDTVEVSTAADSSVCGLPDLPLDRDVLFFADGSASSWRVNSCGGTAVATGALVARVESKLGEWQPEPTPAPDHATLTPVADGDPETFTRVAAPGLAMVIAGLLGLLLVRRLGGR
ncbi:hypothetical protein [Nocardioides ferulae]|uniref:hypothetical protein n=1 Tax=Nocardioides ferulae TaxID=2340821 RepID=UPI000F894D7D|nr:hypothetical protein [Nocardioides ferulae]